MLTRLLFGTSKSTAYLQWPPIGQSELMTTEEFHEYHSWRSEDLNKISAYEGRGVPGVILTVGQRGAILKAYGWDNRTASSRHKHADHAQDIYAHRMIPDSELGSDSAILLLRQRRQFFLFSCKAW